MSCVDRDRQYTKRLFTKIGATLVGVKPAELLTVKNDESLILLKKIINIHTNIEIVEIKKTKDLIKCTL